MNSESALLTELEIDALTELVNIGVSRAAASLRLMVRRQVMLSVPSIEVTSRRTAAALMSEREVGPLVAISQDFDGAFGGRALLIFPEASSLTLVRAVTGDELDGDELAELEEEALKETGNVVLTNCLATMANMLERPVHMSIPQVMRRHGAGLFQPDPAEAGGAVLFLYINFAIQDHDIRGYLAVLMDVPSLDTLRLVIADFITKVVGRREATGA